MVKDAEVHRDEDKKRKEEIEIRNEADAMMFRATKAIQEYKDKVPASVVSDIQSKIDAVKTALESNQSERIKTATQELSTHMQKIGEEMQKSAGAHAPHPGAQAQASPKPPKKEGEDIEEAEAEIIDDEDKK